MQKKVEIFEQLQKALAYFDIFLYVISLGRVGIKVAHSFDYMK
jgi:hypothetical protein